MPGAYSADLRGRVLRACERGGPSRAEVAAMFAVGETAVDRRLRAWRAEGRREARRGRTPAARRLGRTRRRWTSSGPWWPGATI
jgi:transposase